VNQLLQTVDLHLILRRDIPKERADRLLHALKTEIRAPSSDRGLACSELETKAHFESATVTRDAVREAIERVFGRGRQQHRDNVIVVVPANNSGIRAASSERRKANLADAIDADADAIFGSDANSQYFLRSDRFEDGSPSKPKPVYSGCDAHSFADLEAWLGKSLRTESTYQVTTWIKADVTFEGLQQTLVEPDERVRLQPTQPDSKDPYKVISKVAFADPNVFPAEVTFNENLVSIIGSRSSGKSALLAYIAYAIDPEHTVNQQMATAQFEKRADAGPAAGITWADAALFRCRVEWRDPAVTTGKIIYIPQNSLFAISARPKDITAKIAPALYRLSDQYRIAHDQVVRTVAAANDEIVRAVGDWFRARAETEAIKARIRNLGDRKAIEATKVSLENQIDELRKEAALSDGDVAAFDALTATFRTIDARVAAIELELAQLSPFIEARSDTAFAITSNVRVDVQIRPLPSELGAVVGGQLQEQVEQARDNLLALVAKTLVGHRRSLGEERQRLIDDKATLERDNSDLVARNTASAQIEQLLQGQAAQAGTLASIDGEEKRLAEARAEQAVSAHHIEEQLAERSRASQPLTLAFNTGPNDLDGMSFGFEEELEAEVVDAVSNRFNKLERSTYIDSDTRTLDISKAQAEPAAFLEAVASKSQKLVKGVEPAAAATEALVATPTLRFLARLDDDRIGGFQRSSMTPGKQALFALTLTLSESNEAWPLLIDQPEDDLDSRAIYDTIVPYLKKRKRERQILMVTHNANLVVGADSEQLIVTNRHGNDRQNRNGRTFSYLTGSIEQSESSHASPYVLETCGIREHACEILDGGEEAFEKRRDKYKMY
jgi:hypothetical protein